MGAPAGARVACALSNWLPGPGGCVPAGALVGALLALGALPLLGQGTRRGESAAHRPAPTTTTAARLVWLAIAAALGRWLAQGLLHPQLVIRVGPPSPAVALHMLDSLDRSPTFQPGSVLGPATFGSHTSRRRRLRSTGSSRPSAPFGTAATRRRRSGARPPGKSSSASSRERPRPSRPEPRSRPSASACTGSSVSCGASTRWRSSSPAKPHGAGPSPSWVPSRSRGGAAASPRATGCQAGSGRRARRHGSPTSPRRPSSGTVPAPTKAPTARRSTAGSASPWWWAMRCWEWLSSSAARHGRWIPSWCR